MSDNSLHLTCNTWPQQVLMATLRRSPLYHVALVHHLLDAVYLAFEISLTGPA